MWPNTFKKGDFFLSLWCEPRESGKQCIENSAQKDVVQHCPERWRKSILCILGPSNRNLEHYKQHFKSPLCVIKAGNPGLNCLHLVGAKEEKETIRKGGGEEEREERGKKKDCSTTLSYILEVRQLFFFFFQYKNSTESLENIFCQLHFLV